MLPIDVTAFWPLSRPLFLQILEDRCSDRFVCERIWERLGYDVLEVMAGMPEHDLADWADATSRRHQEVIAERPASVRLTRSIGKPHKQLLKQQLAFSGYRIGELYPRRTRRATAVSWLLAWLMQRGEPLAERGPWRRSCRYPRIPWQGIPGIDR